METSLLRDQSFDLELQAMGDHFTFRKDGSDLVSGNMSGYDRGHVGFRFEVGTIVKSLEVMPLDGLTPEQQKAALNASKATDSKHPPPDVSSSSAAAPSPTAASPTPKAAMPVATAPLSTAPDSTSNSAFSPSWTDRNGRRITAEFVRADSSTLTIRMNGKVSQVPLSALSDVSRRQAVQLASAGTSSARSDTDGFTNSLGMKFVPVEGTSVLFCIHETRYRDFDAFTDAMGMTEGQWKKQEYYGFDLKTDKPDHPVTKVSARQAMQFCAWLGQKDGRKYRLPTSDEWSIAVGVNSSKTASKLRKAQAGKTDGFPWGTTWPPPQGAGNYSDESYHKLRPSDPYLSGYDDGFPTTAPVMRFKPNGFGLYDMGGNVWEMAHAGDPTAAILQDYPPIVQRGASFLHDSRDALKSTCNSSNSASIADPDKGFRIVVELIP